MFNIYLTIRNSDKIICDELCVDTLYIWRYPPKAEWDPFNGVKAEGV